MSALLAAAVRGYRRGRGTCTHDRMSVVVEVTRFDACAIATCSRCGKIAVGIDFAPREAAA